ncbi:hypothetical protein GGR54DRAFT_644256 [Hypoxylon sp. NC1633]|nr:hypothetical protein GGR54DRAFT_644256 [Hypoxylon sp. NC1633]
MMLLVFNIWGTFADSFSSLAAMRILQGVASAPLETLVTSTVSDLFYVHQKGLRFSLWDVMLATGVLLGQIISGFIIESLGIPGPEDFESDNPANKPREGYKNQLQLLHGRLSEDSFWKGVLKPFPLICFHVVIFSTLVYASFFCWLLMIGVLSINVFSAPRYNLNPAQIGPTNVPLAIGALIFSPLSGWMADAIPVWMAKANNGIFEPVTASSSWLSRFPSPHCRVHRLRYRAVRSMPLTWCLVWITMHSVAVPFASQDSISYVVDCHAKDANQAFVTIIFVCQGPPELHCLHSRQGIAFLNLGIGLLTIPCYIYGKRLRSWVARSEWAKKMQRLRWYRDDKDAELAT